jgi:hypothetical protein
MNAEFFALAFTAALNPKLLAFELLLIENQRPRNVLSLLLGGLTVGIATACSTCWSSTPAPSTPRQL